MTPVFKVIAPGFLTTVQDEGRRGFQHVGVPVAGALDRDGFTLANALVGNRQNSACLEVMGSGPELEVVCDSARIALVGGGGGLEIKGGEQPLVPSGQTVRLTKGEIVRVKLGGDAFCSYLAIEGGFDVPLCLNSRSTYTRAAFGGLEGRQLQGGDILNSSKDDVAVREEVALSEPRDLRFGQPIRVVLGPQDDFFTEAAIQEFLSGTYTITAASDRMGFRLDGPLLEHKGGNYNIVSDGIVGGSIQVPGSKLPIILLADAQTAGGYPKIATVISADLPLLGVRGSGRSIRFEAVSREEAETIRRAEHKRIQDVIQAIRPVGGAQGINLEALYNHNLIDGVVDAYA
ncbi:biotin-dependent carboxyltransferase family protein [Bradyrhizobium sp. SYSU BS000235]|uniref:5-oxoprolinase subunit C family protein n=1 Tax=Bradyrhizobium sp. SYSU BS000235 TaxID=3411332 RepID=UPI003C7469F4